MRAKPFFGQWLKRRRKVLDITQAELAQRVGCAVVTIVKIEADDRRPSKQIARLLAQHLEIPPPEIDEFISFARNAPGVTIPAIPWSTPFFPPNNLPVSPTPLIGREQDVTAVRKRLLHTNTQVLTLVGPPGIGKTRLSLAVANEVLDDFADGVFLVLLASITDPKDVPDAIVRTLGLQDIGPQSPLERLRQYLRDRQILLVLDNFEQVLPAATSIAELLTFCPFIKVLVTSRAPLRIRRERQYLVPTLALPDVNAMPDIDALSTYAAVELFIERAQAVKHDFTLSNENAQPITAICNRLDGLPLAIELISARVKLLPPAALLERLQGPLILHSDGLRDLEPRHRTLNAAIAWSYDLLAPHEQLFFQRLGVFSGGCSLEAAAFICQPEFSLLNGMTSLLDKSLVQPATSIDEAPRFAMLETIREYALQRLIESGESQAIRQRHAHFFLKLAESWRGEFPPVVSQATWLDQMGREYENLRAALAWCLTNDLETGLRLVRSMGDCWVKRGRLVDGRFWSETYLDMYRQNKVVSPEGLRMVLGCFCYIAFFQADLAAMRQHAEELLVLGRKHQDCVSLMEAFLYLGMDALQQENFERAKSLFEERLALAQQLNDHTHAATALLMLGNVANGQNDYSLALAHYDESLALYQQLGDRWNEALILSNKAIICAQQGNHQQAYILCRQSLSISQELEDRRSLSGSLEVLAGLIDLKGDTQRAIQIMGAAEALREALAVPVEPLDQVRHECLIEHLHAKVDATTFSAAWAEGRLMSLEQGQVIEYALAE